MDNQIIRKRSFVFEANGALYRYSEISWIGSSEPRVTIDLTSEESSESNKSIQPTGVHRIVAEIEDDHILLNSECAQTSPDALMEDDYILRNSTCDQASPDSAFGNDETNDDQTTVNNGNSNNSDQSSTNHQSQTH